MESSLLVKVILPLALFVIMLGMGMSLVPGDFARVVKKPKAVAVGITLQMLVLPLLGLGVIKLFGLSGAMAIGLFVLALSPGGTTSNMLSYLSRGDIALSITLTAVVSLVTPFTIPLMLAPALEHFMTGGQAIELPIGKTIITLLAITALPVGVGMFIRSRAAGFAIRSEKPVKWLSLLFLALVIAGIMRENWEQLPTFFAQAGLSSLTLNVSALVLGFFVSKGLRLGRDQSVTIGIEVGIQNGTTALFVTGEILKNAEMGIPPAIYSLIMFATGALFAVLVNLGRKGAEPAAAAQ
ncbi:MAG: bile acid:sodium symporter family protein [Myxococcales bacterium]|nr:bile acid:sodium symporter family protein [Myxococcales bacterium]